jgi:hypothetical protein
MSNARQYSQHRNIPITKTSTLRRGIPASGHVTTTPLFLTITIIASSTHHHHDHLAIITPLHHRPIINGNQQYK